MSIIIMWRVFLTILGGWPHFATAFVEFDPNGPAAKQFEHPSIQPRRRRSSAGQMHSLMLDLLPVNMKRSKGRRVGK